MGRPLVCEPGLEELDVDIEGVGETDPARSDEGVGIGGWGKLKAMSGNVRLKESGE